MPLYDYDCAACGRRFEVIHGVHADGPTTCPLCGKGPVRKAITAAAIHYKGSGWAKKERRASTSSGHSKSSGDGGSSSGATSDQDADRAAGSASKSEPGATGESGRDGGKDGKSSSTAPSKAAGSDAAKTSD